MALRNLIVGRQTCIACDADLVKWDQVGIYNGWKRKGREGKYFCLTCKRLIKVTATVAVFIGGVLGGFAFKLLTKLGWL